MLQNRVEYDVVAREYISLTLAVHIEVQCTMWGSASKVAGTVIGQQPTWGDLNTFLESSIERWGTR